MGKEIWIMAGESSGDLYGARLARELRNQMPDINLRGMGMQAMRKQGVDTIVDSTDLGVVGFVEVVKHLPTFLGIFKNLVGMAARERPDCVVLIDYPGFNLRFARKMHALGIPVVYYISPQVWAWGRHRIPKIATWCRKVLAIFPFEPAVYDGTGLDVEFVGHPLVGILQNRINPSIKRDPDLIMLLPGSRRSEIERLLKPVTETAAWLATRSPQRKFVLPVPNERIRDLVVQLLAKYRAANPGIPAIRIVEGDADDWFQTADAGLAASGTVTMQAAIFGLPLVSIYRVSPLTYLLGRMLVDIPYFTMVNLVAGRLVFEEFLQGDVRPEKLGPAVEAIMRNGTRRKDILAGIAEAVAALGSGHDSFGNAAKAVLEVCAEPARICPARTAD